MKLPLLILLGLMLAAPSAHAGLYEDIRSLTQAERGAEQAELTVDRSVRSYLRTGTPFSLENGNVDLVLKGEYLALCKEYSRCKEHFDAVIREVRNQEDLRTLGRDLQMIASSYETGNIGYEGDGRNLAGKAAGIVNIWQAGVDEMTNPYVVKQPEIGGGASGETPDITEQKTEILNALNALLESEGGKTNADIRTAAVWRYRDGVRTLRFRDGSCNEQLPPNVDPQHINLLRRYCTLEDKLVAVWETLGGRADADDPAAGKSTLTVEELTPSILLWVRDDDAGLQWELPVEPVFPNIVAGDSAVLGGAYPANPEEPEPNTGICSHPNGSRGYLCRPLPSSSCPVTPSEEAPEDGIRITECIAQNMETDVHRTDAGPDACRIAGWRVPNGLESEHSPACSNCRVSLQCGAGCSATPVRGEDGAWSVCVDDSFGTPTYTLLHNLVAAQLACEKNADGAPSVAAENQCCSDAWYPSLVTCRAMMDDGNLSELGLTPENCAAALVQKTCGAVCSAVPIDAGLPDAIIASAKKNVSGASTACEQVIEEETMDVRAQMIVASLPDACSPECVAKYENSIGNNLCYIGGCVEQSVETQRLTPGRMTFVVADEVFPWDSCRQDNAHLDANMRIPFVPDPRIPDYDLPAVMLQLDRDFCQTRGLPALTPPIRCAANPGLRLSLPNRTFSETNIALDATAERIVLDQDLQRAALGVTSARLSAELHREYLFSTPRGLTSIAEAMSDFLLRSGTDVFPTVACPRHYTGDCSLFQR